MKNSMFLAILLSIVLSIVCGIYFPHTLIKTKWIGELFMNLLKLIVLPLIVSAIVSAIAAIGDRKKMGSIGLYTLLYVLLSMSIAVIIGLVLLNVFHPGVGLPKSLVLANASPTELKTLPFSEYVLSMFPPNIIAAAARYEIMPLVMFSFIFAIACISVGRRARPVIVFFTALREILIRMIVWLMYLTPFGLFSLLGAAVAEASLQHLLLKSITGLMGFITVFLSGLFLQFLWQLIFLRVVLKRNPRQFLKTATNAMFTAFATSSSMATLPVTFIVATEENISDEVSRFVLPLATTLNLASTAMYEAVSAIFFCQILGFHLTIFAQIGVFLLAIMAGMGATGIPEGGLITMVMVLKNVNVPLSAIGLLLPFDRILDRFRTMTNVWGDLVCAATVEHFHQRKLNRTPARRS